MSLREEIKRYIRENLMSAIGPHTVGGADYTLNPICNVGESVLNGAAASPSVAKIGLGIGRSEGGEVLSSRSNHVSDCAELTAVQKIPGLNQERNRVIDIGHGRLTAGSTVNLQQLIHLLKRYRKRLFD